MESREHLKPMLTREQQVDSWVDVRQAYLAEADSYTETEKQTYRAWLRTFGNMTKTNQRFYGEFFKDFAADQARPVTEEMMQMQIDIMPWRVLGMSQEISENRERSIARIAVATELLAA
jgi:hypothetical protein